MVCGVVCVSSTSNIHKNYRSRSNWTLTDILIIDEVSMLSKKMKREKEQLYGSIQSLYGPIYGLFEKEK
jgi:hypothetical protein